MTCPLFKTTILGLLGAFLEVCISRRLNHRESWFVLSAGEVYDVAVDIRKGSATFGEWEGVILSEDNKKQFWVPPGFAHGFVVLSDTADFEYKCTDYYDPSDEGCILWSDPDLDIPWPIANPVLSTKDESAKRLVDLRL